MASKTPYMLALLCHGLATFAQSTNANFNQVININGDMVINSVQFPDGSRVETFSQTQRQMLVNQNQAPLPGNQVTGTTGNPFMQLSSNSLIIQTNGAIDLVGAQIELPINNQMMQQNNINMDNTFVAKLATDRRSWMVMETIKSVNGSDNTVRIVKMNNIDGEYIALGRQTMETGLSLTQFGGNRNQAFNLTGSGIQENEFTDGFRMSVQASQPMTINTDVKNGISSTMLAALQPGTQSVNNYRYLVSTNLGGVVTNINRMTAVVQLPINPTRLQNVAKSLGAGPQSNVRISIAQRGILINPGGAQGSLQRRQDNSSMNQGENGNNNQNGGNNNGNNNNENNNNGNNGNNNGNNNNGNNNNGNGNNNNGNNGNNNNGNNNNGGNNNNNQGSSSTNNNPAATRLLLSPTFTPIAANAVLDMMNGRLAIPVQQLDGEYIITLAMANGAATQQQPPEPAGQQPNNQQPNSQQPNSQQPNSQQPNSQQPNSQQPNSQQPNSQQPNSQRPEPANQQPAGGQSSREPSGQAPEAGAQPQPAPRPEGQGVQQPGDASPAAQSTAPIRGQSQGSSAATQSAPAPAAAAGAGANSSPASGSFIYRRQIPSMPVNQADGSIIVGMDWVNYMAGMQRNGLSIDVGAMMRSVQKP